MKYNLELIENQIASEVKVDADGKATFSLRASARLAGIDHSTLSKAFSCGEKNVSKLAQYLAQSGFDLVTISNFGKTGIPDIAVSEIIGYYAYDAGERCTEQAKQAARAFRAIGIRAYAHKIAKYNQQDQEKLNYETALKQLLETEIPAIPKQYEVCFHKRFWDALEKCYGLKQSQRACSNFIKHRIYLHLPTEVWARLEVVNPVTKNGYRARLLHQHVDHTFYRLLSARIDSITLLLEVASNRKDFLRMVKKIRPIRFDFNSVKILKSANN